MTYGDNTRIEGFGRGVTILKQASGTNITGSHAILEPDGWGTPAPVDYYVQNVSISHLSIDGDQANNGGGATAMEGIAMLYVRNGSIDDVEAYNCSEVGINAGTYSTNSPTIVTNCFAHDNLSDGFQINGGVFSNLWSYDNTSNGIHIVCNGFGDTNYSICLLSNSFAFNNGTAGIVHDYQLGDYIPSNITNCSCINNGDGIILASNRITCSHNYVAMNKSNGIRVQNDNTKVVGNTVVNNGQDPAYDPTFNTMCGIAMLGEKNGCQVLDNMVFDDQVVKTQAYGLGISLGYVAGSNNLVSLNDFSGNTTDIDNTLVTALDYTFANNL
jgi:hypothetical protein